MAPKTVLVTGTNRGIGLEIAKQFLSKGYTVISAVRSPEKQPALTPSDDARHIIVQLDIGQPQTIKAAIEKIREDFGVQRLDIVINNAAIGVTHQNAFMVRDAKSSEYTEAWRINLVGTLELFVSVYAMLPKTGQGKFVAISTLAAVQSMLHWPLGGAYTTSKNAVNYLVRQIHSEESELIAFTISPGWVDTDMGHEGAAVFGAADGPPEKVSVTVPQLVATIENATRNGEGGRMINYNGEPFDW